MDGSIDLDTDNIRVILVKVDYTPNQDSHDFLNDIGANEITGATGYTAGGQTLAGCAVSVDNTDNEGVFDANDVTWATSTISARAGVLCKYTGDSSTSPLIAYSDFGETKTSSNGDFVIQWNAEGIVNIG